MWLYFILLVEFDELAMKCPPILYYEQMSDIYYIQQISLYSLTKILTVIDYFQHQNAFPN